MIKKENENLKNQLNKLKNDIGICIKKIDENKKDEEYVTCTSKIDYHPSDMYLIDSDMFLSGSDTFLSGSDMYLNGSNLKISDSETKNINLENEIKPQTVVPPKNIRVVKPKMENSKSHYNRFKNNID